MQNLYLVASRRVFKALAPSSLSQHASDLNQTTVTEKLRGFTLQGKKCELICVVFISQKKR